VSSSRQGDVLHPCSSHLWHQNVASSSQNNSSTTSVKLCLMFLLGFLYFSTFRWWASNQLSPVICQCMSAVVCYDCMVNCTRIARISGEKCLLSSKLYSSCFIIESRISSSLLNDIVIIWSQLCIHLRMKCQITFNFTVGHCYNNLKQILCSYLLLRGQLLSSEMKTLCSVLCRIAQPVVQYSSFRSYAMTSCFMLGSTVRNIMAHFIDELVVSHLQSFVTT